MALPLPAGSYFVIGTVRRLVHLNPVNKPTCYIHAGDDVSLDAFDANAQDYSDTLEAAATIPASGSVHLVCMFTNQSMWSTEAKRWSSGSLLGRGRRINLNLPASRIVVAVSAEPGSSGITATQ
jgi:hypothetical protein